ncbi:hypothetical protein F2Q69_00029769 [Brassica cretica]|uniref:Uncharacterized protein n=1 Tax=Brassica cretica TaxID=69181 RepID=A0A8S9S8I8_BRACR|nr:hypothetical protein F2Q69_00029769 [Brassica cretica]
MTLEISSETSIVVINGDGKSSCELDVSRTVVSDLLLELEGLPPALGSDVVVDVPSNVFEVGGTSKQIPGMSGAPGPHQEWALVGGKSPSLSTEGRQRGIKTVERVQDEEEGIISLSIFSVLATEKLDEDEDVGKEEEVDENQSQA